MKRILVLILTLSPFHVSPSQSISLTDVSGETLLAWVRGIEGRDPAGRREFVKQEIQALGLSFRSQPFSHQRKNGTIVTGENIIVPLGKGAKNVVIGAHYDAVPGSPGANDNGGGVAVLLGILRSMKDFLWTYEIDVCFFDQEEVGLVGSQEFVKTYADSLRHLAMVNLDVEGMGDVVYAGPVGGGDDDMILPHVTRASEMLDYPLKASEYYPPSDHLSFARRGFENISISIVPEKDVALLTAAVRDGWQIDPATIPEIMKVMHTPNDSSSRVNPNALEMSYRLSRALLLSLSRNAH